jgi:hypothetical protein
VTLFIDDTPGHVCAAEALGMTGRVHTGSASTIGRIDAFLATGEFPADGQGAGAASARRKEPLTADLAAS